jgi:class 3 adenylate cyclase
VNTGQVVVGDASAQQKLATGDAVNVAKRLEEAAPTGEILLGEQTRRLASDTVRVEQLEPLTVKGKAAPISVWRVVELQPDSPAFTRTAAATFVGRE